MGPRAAVPRPVHRHVHDGDRKGVRPRAPKSGRRLGQLLGECWLGEPEKRPEMKDIIPRLREVLAGLEVEGGAKGPPAGLAG